MAKISLNIDELLLEKTELTSFLSIPSAYTNPNFSAKNKRLVELDTLIEKATLRQKLETQLVEARILTDGTGELAEMAKQEVEDIKEKLTAATSYCFHDDGTLNSKYFYDYLYKKFNSGSKSGYYGWHGLRYFLYEYELNLLSQSRQKKVAWEDLLKTPKDKVSIEHVFPQTPTDNWKNLLANVDEEEYSLYSGSIGNLLLLSMSINSSLQNDDFDDKKKPKFNEEGKKIRNGYSDGSHSEIEVAQNDKWTTAHIEERGLRLLNFMEERWSIKFKDDAAKKSLLFLENKHAID